MAKRIPFSKIKLPPLDTVAGETLTAETLERFYRDVANAITPGPDYRPLVSAKLYDLLPEENRRYVQVLNDREVIT
jgi:hypothetical protein